jgi:hypothetical protein
MNMPGFDAESSLYTSAGRYRSMPTGLQSEGTTIVPAQGLCLPFSSECGACISLGPSIFSRGRRHCKYKSCQQTIFGGCRCRVFRGNEICDPSRDNPVSRLSQG